MDQLTNRLHSLADLPLNWNSYGAEAPNHTAIIGAENILQRAHEEGILPDTIDPSAENGVVLSFSKRDRYADIECFNSGEILAVMHDRSRGNAGKPNVWTVQDEDGIAAALDSIRAFVYA